MYDSVHIYASNVHLVKLYCSSDLIQFVCVVLLSEMRSTHASSSDMVNLDNILGQIENNDCKLIVSFMKTEFKTMDDKFSGMFQSKNTEIYDLKRQINLMSGEMMK